MKVKNSICIPAAAASCALLLAGAVSCSKDAVDGGAGGGGVTLLVTLPDPVVKNPVSRVGAIDFDEVRDLNIVLAAGGDDDSKILRTVFVTEDDDAGDPSIQGMGGSPIVIHFSEDYVREYGLSNKRIYIAANLGYDVGKGKTVGRETVGQATTVGGLKSIRQENADNPGIPVGGCLMFAEAVSSGSHTHENTGAAGASLSAELKRTVAMITVAVDGSGLDEGVSVVPREISLHRVPETGYIGKANSPHEDNSIGIVADGEGKGGGGELNWPVVVGSASKDKEWAQGAVQIAGKHYEGGGEGQGELQKNDLEVSPLFMYENYHGEDFGGEATDERHKRPVAYDGSDYVDGLFLDESTRTCSYLEVEALYTRRKDDGSVDYGGVVRFRFFLGEDAVKSFDVMRNHYYKVTLSLSGNAVTEGGQVNETGELIPDGDALTWRVDSDFTKAYFETSDIVVNASGEFIPIDILASDDVNITVSAGGYSNEFIWIYNKSQGSLWSSVSGNVNATILDGDNGNKRVWVYVQPWSEAYDFTFDQENNTARYLNVELKITSGGRTETRTLKITQYKPIIYTASGQYIIDIFGRDNVEILIDRVDRSAMPWGFDGVVLDYETIDAFKGTYHLIEEDPHGDGTNHQADARKYLPWGKNNGGSAMIYCMTLWDLPTQGPGNSDIEDMIQDTEIPDIKIDQDHINQGLDYYWTLPSVLGWQIIEKAMQEGKIDDNHPILPYLYYWTSNPVTADATKGEDGKAYSYTYQVLRGLDKLQRGDPYPSDLRADRSHSLRFRLVGVKGMASDIFEEDDK